MRIKNVDGAHHERPVRPADRRASLVTLPATLPASTGSVIQVHLEVPAVPVAPSLDDAIDPGPGGTLRRQQGGHFLDTPRR